MKHLATKRDSKNRSIPQYLVKCECGKEWTVSAPNRTNNCKECSNRLGAEKRKTHGDHNTALYAIWRSMKARCNSPKAQSYKNYGAKGVSVCKEWNSAFEPFRDWAKTSGYVKGMHLDKDEKSKKLGFSPAVYSPDTCQWITQQANNKIELQMNTDSYEKTIVSEYERGRTITSIANQYYNGRGKSTSAKTKYIESVLKRHKVWKRIRA